jgi:hypothetical protein
VIDTEEAEFAILKGARMVCSTRIADPAVPTLKEYEPEKIDLGEKKIEFELR